jgi:hypothetical protein
MPRIIVITDPVRSKSTDAAVLLDEQVQSVHLSTGHAASQLVERIAWAISDAEDAETADNTRSFDPLQPERHSPRHKSLTRTHHTIHA